MPRVGRLPRNSINDRPGRWKLLARRFRRHIRPIGWGSLGLLLLLLGIVIVHANTRGGTLASVRGELGATAGAVGLRVSKVEIDGRENTPEPLLSAALGVSKGTPILSFSVAAARSRIERLSWVESAIVERRLPDTIVVQLKERQPFAIWQSQGTFTLIDRSGQVIANQDLGRFGKLPLIVGTGAPQAAATLLDALASRPQLESHVVAAVRIGERRWNLHLDTGTDVLLPEGAPVAAIDRLIALEQAHALLERPLAVLDLRLPDRLVVRPQPDSGTAAQQPPANAPAPPATHRPT
ncbi:MAG: FtsQ-type POTRA domain-containing protein [Alphaproteobacteria bacterium]|nr:FtsQ-type POTRA domain-containing protein [Alphaproteobacteria bacterium]